MNKTNKKTIFILSVLLFLLLVPPILAKVQLEVEFPDFTGKSLSGDSTLPEAIKEIFNIAIIAIALLIFASLIYGGILYLGSAGSPAKTIAGRKRLIGSVIGLFIVFGSYLLLKVVNPDFLILTIKKVPVETGAIFLDDEGYKAAINPASDIYHGLRSLDDEERNETVRALLEAPAGEPRARYLVWNVSDFRDRFGELELGTEIVGTSGADASVDVRFRFHPGWEDAQDNNIKKYNFKDFKLYGLFFLPEADMKLITYFFPRFNNMTEKSVDLSLSISRDVYKEMLRNFGITSQQFNLWDILEIIRQLVQFKYSKVKSEYIYPNCSALTGGPCKLNMLYGLYGNEVGADLRPMGKKSVPLSSGIEYIGIGIYLYSDKQEQMFPVSKYSSRISELGLYGFNDEAKAIEIKNLTFTYDREAGTWNEPEQEKNYLVILHDDTWFRGKLRIFFETIETFTGKFGNTSEDEIDFDNPDAEINKTNEGIFEIKDEADIYGKVNKASSAQVFQMPANTTEWQKWSQVGCRVKLCTKEAYGTLDANFQDCLEYTFDYPIDAINPSKNSPYPGTPYPNPQNIPDDEDIPDPNDPSKTKNVKFANNIKSMQIKGDCVVVLFENSVNTDDFVDQKICQNWQPGDPCNEYWEKGTPGAKSEVFSFHDKEYPNYKDLTRKKSTVDGPTHPIGSCGFLGGAGTPCASAIAIYPIIR